MFRTSRTLKTTVVFREWFGHQPHGCRARRYVGKHKYFLWRTVSPGNGMCNDLLLCTHTITTPFFTLLESGTGLRQVKDSLPVVHPKPRILIHYWQEIAPQKVRPKSALKLVLWNQFKGFGGKGL